MNVSLPNIIWNIFQFIIGYNLVLPSILALIYTLRKEKKISKCVNEVREPDYAIIVTAYQYIDNLLYVLRSLLKLNYINYKIYVVADNCDVSQLNFNDERVLILRPEIVLASNTKSHFYAIKHFIRNHDRLTIIDSDNLVDPDYLKELNVYFDLGYNAVQGIRKAKNLNTIYARLDAARDMYYHFYDGKVLFNIGSSATLAGSGMAFTVELYRKSLEHLEITGAGFDKVLQYAIVNDNNRIAFAEKAVVYDEKTSKSGQLVKQRARWINTWFRYFSFGFKLCKKGIFRFNWNQFIFGIVLLRPPLFIFIILSICCMIANIWLSSLSLFMWLASFIIFIAGFIISLIHSKADKAIYKSLLGAPLFVFFQLLSLLKIRRANKYSVATQHYQYKKIEEIK